MLRVSLILACLTPLSVFGGGADKCVIGTGTASLQKNNHELTKIIAQKAALVNASLSNNVRIVSDGTVINNSLKEETTNFFTNSSISRYSPVSIKLIEDFETGEKSYSAKIKVCFSSNEGKCPAMGHIKPRFVILPARIVSQGSNASSSIANKTASSIKKSLLKLISQDVLVSPNSLPYDYPEFLSEGDIEPYLQSLKSKSGADFALLPLLDVRPGREPELLDSMRLMHGVELASNKTNIKLELRLINLRESIAPRTIKDELKLPYNPSPEDLKDISTTVALMTENLTSENKCSKGEISIIERQESKYILNKGILSGMKEGDLLRAKNFSPEGTVQSFMRITKTNNYTSIGEPRSEDTEFNVGDKLTSWMY